ncbi:hypothetical protein VNO80_12603 [Phaseolus coccineus]|uniref:Uncharacterized protein n=1 Tax=Phaseolus coccineus TaxID=3886 RepID=A0AAN9N562_PHACN
MVNPCCNTFLYVKRFRNLIRYYIISQYLFLDRKCFTFNHVHSHKQAANMLRAKNASQWDLTSTQKTKYHQRTGCIHEVALYGSYIIMLHSHPSKFPIAS